MDNKKEIRNTSSILESKEDSRLVEGYALLFGVRSDSLSFEESIEFGALDGVIARSDTFAFLDHRENRGVLARSKRGKGSLSLQVDEKGLKYSFEAPNTALGDELLEGIRRGEIDSSSFAFSVAEDLWTKKADGNWKRSIKKIDYLYDVSPVYSAAYSKTSVYMRGKEQAEKELQDQEERAKKADLTAYYDNLHKSLIF